MIHTATVQAIIAGDTDPWDLAVWNQESESFYFGADWVPYDSNDVDRIYAEWFERAAPLLGPVMRLTEFKNVADVIGHAEYTVIAHTEDRSWPSKFGCVQWSKWSSGYIVVRFIDHLRVSEDGKSATFTMCEPPCRLHVDPVVSATFDWYIVVTHHPLDVPDEESTLHPRKD